MHETTRKIHVKNYTLPPTGLRLQDFADLRFETAPGRSGLRGAANPNAKARPWIVDLIREMHAAGWPYSALASAVGLSKTGIARICRREVWRD